MLVASNFNSVFVQAHTGQVPRVQRGSAALYRQNIAQIINSAPSHYNPFGA